MIAASNIGARIITVFLIIGLIFAALDRNQRQADRTLALEQKIESIEREIAIRQQLNEIITEGPVDGSVVFDKLQENIPTPSSQ